MPLSLILKILGTLLLYLASVATIMQFYFGIPNIPEVFSPNVNAGSQEVESYHSTALTVLAREAKSAPRLAITGSEIYINSDPISVDVKVDSQEVGISPIIEYLLLPGTHTINLKSGGLIEEQLKILVEPCRMVTLSYMVFPDTPLGAEWRNEYLRLTQIERDMSNFKVVMHATTIPLYLILSIFAVFVLGFHWAKLLFAAACISPLVTIFFFPAVVGLFDNIALGATISYLLLPIMIIIFVVREVEGTA